MTPDEMFAAIGRHRAALVERLEQLDDDGWDTPTLCEGWRVREVVGHLLAILETPMWKLMLGIARRRGFDPWADRAAREIGAASPADLLARYRAQIDSRFTPPMIGPIAPLTDVMIHTRDIERPLGLDSRLEGDSVCASLDWTCSGKARGFVPTDRIEGLGFDATDLDWSTGHGAEVRGPGEAILLAVTCRPVALDDLQGDGVATLRSRVA